MQRASDVARLLSEMVRIPSVTPGQAGPRAGTPGEARMAAWVAHQLESLGATVHRQEVFPDRHNIFGLFPGRSSKWLGVDVHMDTVGVEQMEGDPFDGRIENGRVYGRGAVDTKATLAVCLSLLRGRPKDKPLPHNLLIAATCDEEGTAGGAPAMARWLAEQHRVLDELAVAEPTRCAPVYGHKGVMRQHYQFHGVAAHSSHPELGKNAISAAARVILAFEAEHDRLSRLPPTVLGQAALTVTLIEGGTGINVVPDHARLSIDRRVVTGERTTELADQLQQLARQASPLPISVEPDVFVEAFHRSPEDDLIQRMSRWAGLPPATVPYGTNAWAYPPAVARQCLVIGPGSIEQAHGAVEWVDISQLEKLAELYTLWWEI